MLQSIKSQIENINRSLKWIKNNKPEDYEAKFLQLVEERRKLRQLEVAKQDNPAIAAYGISQVGKSYLMNCLLQKDGERFMLEANGTAYNFIEQMNPITNGTEATGVVTRFSSFSTDPQRYSKEYPILMRCLSVADIVLIICDGYYNDISDYTTPSEEVIEQKATEIYERYHSYRENPTSALQPEDILGIKEYITKHINKAQSFIHKKAFFDKIALVADRIPANEWEEVFSVLWANNPYQSKLFRRMIDTLGKFEYKPYVYLPVEALLHNNIPANTVMGVQCLNELFSDSPSFFTDVYLREGENYSKIEHVTKSEVCAVCAEIIVKISDKYLDNTDTYCFDNITDPNVTSRLTQGEVKMDILRENDMLDFPGARSRKQGVIEALNEDKTLLEVLLRGKVAYLFNKYNSAKLINILLYCHHAKNNEVTEIPILLRNWIMNNVGNTMEQRRRTLELTGNISPLFYIGTMFNLDMRHVSEEGKNSRNGLFERWDARFFKVLYKECLAVDGTYDDEKVKIYQNWTRPGQHFCNSYILRDYKFSGEDENRLYAGEKTSAKRMLLSKDFYNSMRETFCESEAVRRFFTDPALSWDVCASIDNDGALYIIENLSKIATKMNPARDEMFRDVLLAVTKKLIATISPYFVSTDLDELLEGNIKKSRSIFREMDFTCNADNYYFGHLLQALQMTEKECLSVVHKIIQDPHINEEVRGFSDYEIIRKSCEKFGYDLEQAKTDKEKWECLMNTYSFDSHEEAEETLKRKGISVERLFSGEYKRKLNSCIVADGVADNWISSIRSVDFQNEFTNENGFDSSIMNMLIDNIIHTAETINLRDAMAESIAEYVNVVNIHTANESLLADILANRINDFVLNFGFDYLSDEEKKRAKAICEKRNIPAFRYICKELPATYSETELTAIFDQMATSPQTILPSFDDQYNMWIEYMFISFIANLNVPDFDHEANRALQAIIESAKQV